VAEGVRGVSAADYLTIFWSVLAAVGALSSAIMLVAAERHGAHAQAWLAAVCFFWEGP
jgi:hypothetical protein